MLSFQIVQNITLFKCNHFQKIKQAEDYYQNTSCPDYDIYFYPFPPYDLTPIPLKACSSITLPVNLHPDPYSSYSDPFAFLTSEIRTEGELSKTCFDCHMKRGQCLTDGKFCTVDQKRKDPKAVIIGLAAGGVFLISISFLIILRIKDKRYNWSVFLNSSRSIYFDIHPSTNPGCVSVDFGVPIFSYEEKQKATNNFDPSRELGSGGFGTVYYGQLKDGWEVAVKHLYQWKRDNRRVKQFMNKIQILRRLRHRNLVSLCGCTSLHSHGLLLINEYIPNGTVASHLHGDLEKHGSLQWPIRMKIALETASALTYLHTCDIIRCDVKTSNILPDNNFCVKVADFGISRVSPNDVSHVSTAFQGTMGYVDLEYHESCQLTKKGDVYSFGVVLIELISSMQAVDVTRNIDEIKLANLAMKKIQRRVFAELVDHSLCFDSNNDFMIFLVGELAFQCLQRDKKLRPSMDKVWEVLLKIESGQEKVEPLEVRGGEIS